MAVTIINNHSNILDLVTEDNNPSNKSPNKAFHSFQWRSSKSSWMANKRALGSIKITMRCYWGIERRKKWEAWNRQPHIIFVYSCVQEKLKGSSSLPTLKSHLILSTLISVSAVSSSHILFTWNTINFCVPSQPASFLSYFSFYLSTFNMQVTVTSIHLTSYFVIFTK